MGVIVVGLATVVGAVVGGIVGGGVVARTHPTKADVREGAHSLVPPGYTVRAERLNPYGDVGSGFVAPPYSVELDIEGGGPLDDRLSDFHRQAVGEGWEAGGKPSWWASSASNAPASGPGSTSVERARRRGSTSPA